MCFLQVGDVIEDSRAIRINFLPVGWLCCFIPLNVTFIGNNWLVTHLYEVNPVSAFAYFITYIASFYRCWLALLCHNG